ncbi:hypothetical protein N7493_004818 [Penicillium malachiteum]|uniref:Uncharacterized protein n=1 Tax=Penicillium malachiteum TaxID=1324776 RepID=A0AAD6MXE3_9EURO|nr:hypothetical protein N7493_004818 [Penicillium malachiteum]
MLCLVDHLVKFPHLKPMITSLVHSLYNGTIKLTSDLINYVPYCAVIDAVGGIATFSNIACNAVDPRVLALQGPNHNHREISQEQEQDPWPYSS